MAQVQQDTTQVDPATAAFVADRFTFWNRFTNFTTGAAVVIIILLIAMWLFLA